MNPSIAFEIKPNQFCVVRLRPKSLEKHIKSPEAFNAFIAAISEGAYHNMVEGGHRALPLGPELSGAWLASSPMGKEFTTPGAGWRFEERIALAMSLETHPLMVIPAQGQSKRDVEMVAERVLGSIVKTKTTIHQERTLLDESLDNLWGDMGGTC